MASIAHKHQSKRQYCYVVLQITEYPRCWQQDIRQRYTKMLCPTVCLFQGYLRVVVVVSKRLGAGTSSYPFFDYWALQAFDETRLPLPMTAIYAEMRAAARKALVGSLACVYMYDYVCGCFTYLLCVHGSYIQCNIPIYIYIYYYYY